MVLKVGQAHFCNWMGFKILFKDMLQIIFKINNLKKMAMDLVYVNGFSKSNDMLKTPILFERNIIITATNWIF